MDCSPLDSSVHGILQEKNTGVGCHALQGIFLPRNQSRISYASGGWVLYHWCHLRSLHSAWVGKTEFRNSEESQPNVLASIQADSWCHGGAASLLELYLCIGCAGSLLLHGPFSSCGKWGLLFRCGTQVSHCGTFSSCRARALRHTGLSGGSTRALERRLSSCAARAISSTSLHLTVGQYPVLFTKVAEPTLNPENW